MGSLQNGRHQTKSKTKDMNSKENVVFERIVPQAVKQMWMKVSSTSAPSTRHDHKNKINKNTQKNSKENSKEISKEFGDAFLSHDINHDSNSKKTHFFYQQNKFDKGVSDSPELPIARSKWGIILRHVERRDPALYGKGSHKEHPPYEFQRLRSLSGSKGRSLSQSSDDVLFDHQGPPSMKKSQSMDALSDSSIYDEPRVDIDKLNESFQDDMRSVKDIGSKFEQNTASHSNHKKSAKKLPPYSSRLSKSEASLVNGSIPSERKTKTQVEDEKRKIRTKHRSLAELLQQDEIELTKDVRDDITTSVNSNHITNSHKPPQVNGETRAVEHSHYAYLQSKKNTEPKTQSFVSYLKAPPVPTQVQNVPNHSSKKSVYSNSTSDSSLKTSSRESIPTAKTSKQHISDSDLNNTNTVELEKPHHSSSTNSDEKSHTVFVVNSTFFQGDTLERVNRKSTEQLNRRNLHLNELNDAKIQNTNKIKPKIVRKVSASPVVNKPKEKSPVNISPVSHPLNSPSSDKPSHTSPVNPVADKSISETSQGKPRPVNTPQSLKNESVPSKTVYNKLGQIVLDSKSSIASEKPNHSSNVKSVENKNKQSTNSNSKYENFIPSKNSNDDNSSTDVVLLNDNKMLSDNIVHNTPRTVDKSTDKEMRPHAPSRNNRSTDLDHVMLEKQAVGKVNEVTYSTSQVPNENKYTKDTNSKQYHNTPNSATVNKSETVKQLENGKSLSEESSVDIKLETKSSNSTAFSEMRNTTSPSATTTTTIPSGTTTATTPSANTTATSTILTEQRPIPVPRKRSNSKDKKDQPNTNFITTIETSKPNDNKSDSKSDDYIQSHVQINNKMNSQIPLTNPNIEESRKRKQKDSKTDVANIKDTSNRKEIKMSTVAPEKSSDNPNATKLINRRVGQLIVMSGDERDLDLKQKARGQSSQEQLGIILTFFSNEVADSNNDDECFTPPIIIFNNPPKRVKSNIAPMKTKRAKKVVTFKTKEVAIIHHYPSEASYFDSVEESENFATYQQKNDNDIIDFIERERERITMETVSSPAKDQFRKQTPLTMEGGHFNTFLQDDGAQAMLF